MAATREFLGLLVKPRIQKKMFKCEQSQSDWCETFACWDVLYVWSLVTTSLVLWFCRVFWELSRLKLGTVVEDILFTVVDILLCTVLNGLSWYCVTKRLGFCGRPGYLVWAVIYVFLSIGRLQTITWSHWFLFYILMLIPAGYMILALIQLYRSSRPGLLTMFLFQSIISSIYELLDADDVAATLSFYNDICATQASIAGSVKDTWECKLFDIRVSELEGADWDPTTNRALPDVDKDAEMNGTRGILESKAGQNKSNQELAMQRRHEVNQICSDTFFGTHVVIGDDPRKVPLGNVSAFSKRVHEVGPGLAADYDSDLLHGHGLGAVKDDLKQIETEVKQLKQTEQHVDQGLRQMSTRMNKRWQSLGLLDVDKPDPAEVKSLNGTGTGKTSGTAGGTAKDEKDIGSGCFDPGDVAGLLRDLWETHAGNTDEEKRGLTEGKAKALVQEVLPNTTSDTWPQWWKEMNPNGDDSLSSEEFLTFAETHLREFQWPIRGYLNAECRNHHFGLISLCKPREVSALYQVAFVPGLKNSAGHHMAQQRINVKLSFKELEFRSGWYRAHLRIFTRSCLGAKNEVTVILIVLVLLLLSLLVLIDSFVTVLLLPMNLYGVFQMDLPSEANFQEIQTAFWLKLLQVLDARGVASQFLPTLILTAERFLALAFMVACTQSAIEAYKPTILPFGVLSERCTEAWFKGNKDWIAGQNKPRGIDVIQYIQECSEVHGVGYVAEVLFQILFEDEGSLHALVVGFIMLRILEAFSLSSRLNWLPRTLFLAKSKLHNFLIAYVCLVAGFSLLMTLYFGDIFQQFSSLQESFCTLLLYSFGNTERAFYGAQPFIELGSSHLQAALFFYTVFVVTIILNMFTTIVIDAFAAEGDPERYEKTYQEEMLSVTHRLLKVFGKGHLIQNPTMSRQTTPTPKTEG
eukprot:symbB.v1.2.022228.t1/scaffold1961.1/size94642/4